MSLLAAGCGSVRPATRCFRAQVCNGTGTGPSGRALNLSEVQRSGSVPRTGNDTFMSPLDSQLTKTGFLLGKRYLRAPSRAGTREAILPSFPIQTCTRPSLVETRPRRSPSAFHAAAPQRAKGGRISRVRALQAMITFIHGAEPTRPDTSDSAVFEAK